jgi:hypothetical protein
LASRPQYSCQGQLPFLHLRTGQLEQLADQRFATAGDQVSELHRRGRDRAVVEIVVGDQADVVIAAFTAVGDAEDGRVSRPGQPLDAAKPRQRHHPQIALRQMRAVEPVACS